MKLERGCYDVICTSVSTHLVPETTGMLGYQDTTPPSAFTALLVLTHSYAIFTVFCLVFLHGLCARSNCGARIRVVPDDLCPALAFSIV